MPPDPDPSNPTAPCARCGEARVFAILDLPDPQYFCASCNALLSLSVKDISPG